MRHRGKIVGIAAMVILALVLIGHWNLDDSDPFATCSVVSMRALLNNPLRPPDVPEFQVPAEHIALIQASLEPAVRDHKPALWQVLGLLDCGCADGSRRDVYLYWTGGGPGAFSAGMRGKRKRWYYRGGTNQGIEDAVRNAYAAVKEKL